MIATSTQFGADLAKNTITLMLRQIDDGTKMAYRAGWHSLLAFLSTHLIAVLLTLLLILFVAIAVYLTSGRWAMLGSVLYWYLYFGIIFLIGQIAGTDFFVSDFFHLLSGVALNPICYFTVRIILNKTGIRKP
jgi:hypothetical protein